MEEAAFSAMVARLEERSRAHPRLYRLQVALLAVLGFGLLLAILGLASASIVAIGAVTVWLLLRGPSAVILVAKLGHLILVLAAPFWIIIRSSVSALFTRLPQPAGQEVQARDAPRLFEALNAMRQTMRGPRFHHVLVTDQMNAAVVQRPLFGLIGFPRNYLLLGLPLLESLPPEEALAVVAHEYGHLSGAHAHFGAYIYRLRLSWGTIEALAAQWTGFGARLMRQLIGRYASFFNAYTFTLARANEFDADAASAELVGAEAAANALKRVNVASARYAQFLKDVFAGVRDTEAPPADLAEQWAADAVSDPPESAAVRWLGEALSRPQAVLDTHPPLSARLAALPGQAERAAEPPAPVASASAAETWLGPLLVPLRAAQQEAWQASVAEAWRTQFERLTTERAKLAQLRAVTEPTTEEALERLRLAMNVEPDADHLPEAVAFNAAHPDHAAGLFLEGTLRLNRDEEAAVTLLEQVMRLDGDAITASCERLHAYYLRHGRTEEAARAAQRWAQRKTYEATRTHQLRTLSDAHALVPADLGETELDRVRTLIRTHAKGVARVHLARRVLPADPSVPTYVVGLTLTWWARLSAEGAPILQRFAAEDWQIHAFSSRCIRGARWPPSCARCRGLRSTGRADRARRPRHSRRRKRKTRHWAGFFASAQRAVRQRAGGVRRPRGHRVRRASARPRPAAGPA